MKKVLTMWYILNTYITLDPKYNQGMYYIPTRDL